MDISGFEVKTLDEQLDIILEVCCMDDLTAVSKEALILLLRWLVCRTIRFSATDKEYKEEE